jgi:hygromycin-B 4-O-kinase
VVQRSERDYLSPSAVAEFLLAHGWHDVHSVEPITHGEWSRAFTFDVQDQSREYVVRFSALDDDFRKDQFAARFATSQLRIPRLLDLGQIEGGIYFAISERVRGTFLDELNVDHLRIALPSVFDAIDGMRQADISATRGFGLWDPTGDAPHASWRDALLAIGSDTTGSRIAGWRRSLEQSPTGAQPFDAALDRLRHLTRDLPSARHLIHSDLLNFNVLVERDRVAAVLDWGSAMYGDWLWDVAWFVFWQPWYPAWTGIDFAAEARQHFASIGVDIERFDLRTRCCAIAIGLDNQAYCAFRGEVRWEQLDAVARRTLAFID